MMNIRFLLTALLYFCSATLHSSDDEWETASNGSDVTVVNPFLVDSNNGSSTPPINAVLTTRMIQEQSQRELREQDVYQDAPPYTCPARIMAPIIKIQDIGGRGCGYAAMKFNACYEGVGRACRTADNYCDDILMPNCIIPCGNNCLKPCLRVSEPAVREVDRIAVRAIKVCCYTAFCCCLCDDRQRPQR